MREHNNRIRQEKIELNKSALQEFFQTRSEKYDENKPYVSVLYQDNNSQLAVTRDKYEKNKILPLLKLDGKNRLMDVGCGVGRWADSTLDYLDSYLGIDFNAGLIACAKSRFRTENKATFLVLDAKEITKQQLGNNLIFNRIIISGVLIYMSDNEIKRALKGIASVCDEQCIIYIREPLAYLERLTLDRYWSEELQAHYSAIYRTKEEMLDILHSSFDPNKFSIKPFVEMYDDPEMNNRRETSQFYTFIEGK